MSNIIHMDTDLVAEVVKQLKHTASKMDAAASQLQYAQNRLSQTWVGGYAPTSFVQDMRQTLQRLNAAGTELQHLSNLLEAERQQWLEADRHFGEGTSAASAQTGVVGAAGQASGLPSEVQQIREHVCHAKRVEAGKKCSEIEEVPFESLETLSPACASVVEEVGGRCDSIWSRPPKNAEELAYQTMSLTEDMPFVIMDLGNGEYLVLLRGTTDKPFSIEGWFSDGTDWDQNFPAFLGIPNWYHKAVLQEILSSVPEGATLHFAGHSQGGMVAQNLAADPHLKKYHVETVTMFGSPTTLGKINHEAKYVSYEAVGDVVPKLDDKFYEEVGKAAGKVMGRAAGKVVGRAAGGSIGAQVGGLVGGLVGSSGDSAIVKFYIHYKESFIDQRFISEPAAARSSTVEVSHGVYDDPGALSKFDVPFKSPDKWAGAHSGHRVAGTVEHRFIEPVQTTVAGVAKAAEAVGRMAEKAKSVAGRLGHHGL